MRNDPRFLSPMGEELSRLGLRVEDVNVGRYVKIDLSTPRPVPEEFAEFGRFDTLTVLNANELPDGSEVWIYLNNDRPESRLPLHMINSLDTIADRFYIQHEASIPCVLHLIIGGDLRAFNPRSRELGKIQVPGVATETTLEQARAILETLEAKAATEATAEASRALLETLEAKAATEATAEASRALLETLEAKAATEATAEASRALLETLEAKAATEATAEASRALLETLEAKAATETTLEQVRAILETLEAKAATETTLEQARAILETLEAKAATETTLEQVRAILETLETKAATEVTAEASRALLETLSNVDFSTQTTLAALKDEIDKLTALISDGALKTALTGRKAEVIHARAVRTGNTQELHLVPPGGARGAIVYLKTWGVTGSFAAGEGFGLVVNLLTEEFNARDGWLTVQSERYTTGERNIVVVLSPEPFDLGDWQRTSRNLETLSGTAVLPGRIAVRVTISGTFVEGEGVDCEVKVLWLP